MSCIIWMLSKVNNVRGKVPGVVTARLFSQRRTDAAGVCLWLHYSPISPCFLYGLATFFTAFTHCCLYHRCCPDRHVAFSHTPSSIRTTPAVPTNWTSSSMEENFSSLFCWTLWVTVQSFGPLSESLNEWEPSSSSSSFVRQFKKEKKKHSCS